MTEEEYELLQRKREAIRRYTMERNDQLINSTINLKKEQSKNFIRWTNPTKTDEELKLNQPCYEDRLLSVYRNDAKKINKFFNRIKRILKETFTFDC